jgi:two-component system response regulator AtoC
VTMPCDTLSEATLVELPPLAAEPIETRWALAIMGEGVVALRPLPRIGQVILGSGDEASVPIKHPSLSRQHALLRLGPIITLEDLGSRHGTVLVGQPLAPGQPRLVQPGDVVQLGTVLIALVRAARRP